LVKGFVALKSNTNKQTNQKLYYFKILLNLEWKKIWRTRLRMFLRIVDEYKPRKCFSKAGDFSF
jgi:hypothetical protein